jgi:hypothetical protein
VFGQLPAVGEHLGSGVFFQGIELNAEQNQMFVILEQAPTTDMIYPEALVRLTLADTQTGQETPITLSGTATYRAAYEGPAAGDALDDDGDGFDEVNTELISLDLTGSGPFGPVTLRLDPTRQSQGEVEETANGTPGTLDIDPFGTGGQGDSFFDIPSMIEGLPPGPLFSQDKVNVQATVGSTPPTNETFVATELVQLVLSDGSSSPLVLQDLQLVFDGPPSVTVDPLVTNDQTPGLSGTVDDPVAAIQVTVAGVTHDAVNNGDGTWTLPDGTITVALSEGKHDVAVIATDPAGNVGTDTTVDELEIDLTPPVVVVDSQVSQGGPVTLTGTTDEPSSTVSAFVDGQWHAAVVDGNGKWTVVLDPPPQEGTHTVEVVAVDEAGNEGSGEGQLVVAPPGDELDFGDAPDSYGTLEQSGGPVHGVNPAVYLGFTVDAETDGQPTDEADGDNAAGADDENGVEFLTPLVPGQKAKLRIDASVDGFVWGWIDFNGNNVFEDPEERVLNGQPVAAGWHTVEIDVPAGATHFKFARFRFTNIPGLDLGPKGIDRNFGVIPNGEVEDYPILDYGDAPDDDYKTLRASNGPRHQVVPGVFLGKSVDADPGWYSDEEAQDDDWLGTDDEDGVIFVTPLVPGQMATVCVEASADGFLWGWIDFNGNMQFDPGVPEEIFTKKAVSAGHQQLEFPVPLGATHLKFGRFRFTTDGDLDLGPTDPPDAPLPDGEVEDHALLDFGDAPESYSTTRPFGGPRHEIVPGFSLGDFTDVDEDGQPTPHADGDDGDVAIPAECRPANMVNDEEGVTFRSPLVAGVLATIEVEVSTVPGYDAYLDIWIDYDLNNKFDTTYPPAKSEYVNDKITNFPAGTPQGSKFKLKDGKNTIHFNVPNVITSGVSFARFRLTDFPADSPGGTAPASSPTDPVFRFTPSRGEVEDYQVQTFSLLPDFGDAPDSKGDPRYPTLLENGGALHLTTVADYYLGQKLDYEDDGLPDDYALGDDGHNGQEFPEDDDPDDEDGITFNTLLLPGQQASITAFATLGITPDAKLDAWIDFNADGDWLDGDEQIVTGGALVDGAKAFPFPVPDGATLGKTYARFRMSRQGGLEPGGTAQSGEVEDYVVWIGDPPATRMHATLVDAPTPTDANGEVAALPGSLPWIDEWDTFLVEIWGETPDTTDEGIRSFSADLTYDTESFTATSVAYGPAFDGPQPDVDDATGWVDGIGGSTSDRDVGDDRYVLLARVRFESTPDDAGAEHNANGRYLTADGVFRPTLSDASIDLWAAGSTIPDLGDPPEVELWAVMYDVDDDGHVGFGDLAYFAEAFQQTVEDPDAPFAWACDFDHSGRVDAGDLAFLAENFQNTVESPMVYPANFPEAWRTQATLAGATSMEPSLAAAAPEVQFPMRERHSEVEPIEPAIQNDDLVDGVGIRAPTSLASRSTPPTGTGEAGLHDAALLAHLASRAARGASLGESQGFLSGIGGFDTASARSAGETDAKQHDSDTADWLITQGWD